MATLWEKPILVSTCTKKGPQRNGCFFSEFGVEEHDLTSFDHRALTFWTNWNADCEQGFSGHSEWKKKKNIKKIARGYVVGCCSDTGDTTSLDHRKRTYLWIKTSAGVQRKVTNPNWKSVCMCCSCNQSLSVGICLLSLKWTIGACKHMQNRCVCVYVCVCLGVCLCYSLTGVQYSTMG